MWITEEKLRKFIQSEMRETLLQGASLDSAIAALKDCFSVDNNGNIDVTNTNFELYVGSTVTKTADEKKLAELKSLVSGLYGVLADHSAEDLRRFGLFGEALDRTDAKLEQLRTELLDGVHSVMECQERVLKDVKKELSDVFAEQDRKKLANARANLYKVMLDLWAGRYDQSQAEQICLWSNEIKRCIPDDFIADFCLTVFSLPESPAKQFRFLSDKRAGRTQEERAFVLRTMLHRLKEKRLWLSLSLWLETYENACGDPNDPQYLLFKTAYDRRKQELDSGVYDVNTPRRVFVAFSRKDVDTVLALVDELEKKNITCFVSTRNMLQRSGKQYEEDLERAVAACDVFLLVSTSHSRSDACDAYRIEMMKLLYDNELRSYRKTHGRNCRYEEIPAAFKKKRLEYLVEPYSDELTFEEENVKKLIFYGQDPCNKETLTSAIRAKLLEIPSDEEPAPAPVVSAPAPEQPQASAVKYCGACGTECAATIKFCPNCGGKRFRPTKDAKYCVACGAEVPSSVNFCTECGADDFAETPEDAAEQKEALAEEAKRKAEAEARRKAEDPETDAHDGADVTPAPTSSESATTSAAPDAAPQQGTSTHLSATLKKVLLAVAAFLFVAGVTALLILFAGKIAWWQWQHIIGAVGGAVLVGGLCIGFIALSRVDSVVDEQWFIFFVASIVLSAVNIPLGYVYGDGYSTIFYWVSGYLTLWAIGSAIYAFNDYEEEVGWGCIAAAVLQVLVIVMYACVHEWWQWQHFIGAVGGLILFGGSFLLLWMIYDEDCYASGVFVFGALLIVNLILTIIFKEDYKILSFWMNGCSIVPCAITAFYAFDDDELGFGWVSIIEILVAIGTIITTALVV